ncbi:MAG: hypothetical protein H7Y61_07425, partial [Rhizobiales bacterium]|nr:hypothetical protein [Rhizobacter sp.]
MSTKHEYPLKRLHGAVATALAALLASVAVPALADERAELEQLRATTVALIQALVDQGLITGERLDQRDRGRPQLLEFGTLVGECRHGDRSEQ